MLPGEGVEISEKSGSPFVIVVLNRSLLDAILFQHFAGGRLHPKRDGGGAFQVGRCLQNCDPQDIHEAALVRGEACACAMRRGVICLHNYWCCCRTFGNCANLDALKREIDLLAIAAIVGFDHGTGAKAGAFDDVYRGIDRPEQGTMTTHTVGFVGYMVDQRYVSAGAVLNASDRMTRAPISLGEFSSPPHRAREIVSMVINTSFWLVIFSSSATVPRSRSSGPFVTEVEDATR